MSKKIKEDKPEYVYRIIHKKTGRAASEYSKDPLCGIYVNPKEYYTAKYEAIYKLIKEENKEDYCKDCDHCWNLIYNPKGNIECPL